MSPEEHLAWTRESVNWLLTLPQDVVEIDVGNCPGWTVGTLLDHLGRGVGRGYCGMVLAPPDAEALAVMSAALGPPTSGIEAHRLFGETMPRFLDVLSRTAPDHPCATYEGAGVAAFWRRKAAIELAIHATDVADALGRSLPIEPARALDGIDETVTFALPLALTMLGESLASVEVRAGDTSLTVGEGPPVATITGAAADVLLGFYGRRRVAIVGDDSVALAWLSLIGRAF